MQGGCVAQYAPLGFCYDFLFFNSVIYRVCVYGRRCNSFMGNSAVQKKPQSKPKKPHLSGHKGGSSSREPQPKRLEEVYNALKQGLE